MTPATARKFIISELIDLDVPRTSYAWRYILDNATEAADIMTRAELREYIEGQVEILPPDYFDDPANDCRDEHDPTL